MPKKFASKEEKNAYQRMIYARNETVRRKAVEGSRYRRRVKYAGRCVNCGGPTIGYKKGVAPSFCGKPDCRSAQHKENVGVFVESGRRGRLKQLGRFRDVLDTIESEDECKTETSPSL